MSTISFVPPTGAAGAKVTVNGNGFGKYQNLRLYASDRILAAVACDVNGAFSTQITIPATATGDFILRVAVATATAGKYTIEPNKTRVVLWNGWRYLDPAQVRDQDLDYYAQIGIGGVITSGISPFSDQNPDDYTALAAFVTRMHARGMKVYSGYGTAHPQLLLAPFGDWFDDATWATIVARMGAQAKLCYNAGVDGLAQDSEEYNGAHQYWRWDGYTTHTETEVRAKARQRGAELMTALVSGMPNLDLRSYYDKFGDNSANSWVQHIVNAAPLDNYVTNYVFSDFWAGMSSVNGWSAIRFYDAIFYLGWSPGGSQSPWGYDELAAMRGNATNVHATISKFMSHPERVFIAPFVWAGPTNGDGPGGYFQRNALDAVKSKSVMTNAHNSTQGGEFGVYQYDVEFPLNISFNHFTNKLGTIVDNDYGPAYHAGAWGV